MQGGKKKKLSCDASNLRDAKLFHAHHWVIYWLSICICNHSYVNELNDDFWQDSVIGSNLLST